MVSRNFFQIIIPNKAKRADWFLAFFVFFFPHLPSKPPSTAVNPYSRQGTAPHDLSLFFPHVHRCLPKPEIHELMTRKKKEERGGEGWSNRVLHDEFTVVFCPIVVACMLSAFYGQGQGCIGASRNTLHLIPRALTWSIRSTRFASSRPVRDT